MNMRKQNVVLFQIMVKKIVADNPDISMEDLIQEVSPKATDLVSDRTRREMAEDVKVTLEKAANEWLNKLRVDSGKSNRLRDRSFKHE